MNDFMRRILMLPPQASTVAPAIDHLHYFVISTTIVASTVIGLGALGLFVRFRRRSDIEPTPRVVSPWWAELLIIGVPLGFFLTWFFMGFAQYIRISTPPPNSMEVYVTAKQWMWKFAFPNGPNSIGQLRVPVGRPVKLLMVSRDVIHSFYVPAFRIKKDVLPGRYTQIWFQARMTGTFPIYCAEFCGNDHSNMRAQVIVMKPEEFDEWLASERRGLSSRQDMAPTAKETPPAAEDMAEQGRRLSVAFACVKCHTVDGTPHIGPTWLDLYGRHEKMRDGQVVVADEAYLTQSMMDPLAYVVAGYNPVMPTFQGRLSAPDAAAIVEYIKTLRTPGVTPVPAGGATYGPIHR